MNWATIFKIILAGIGGGIGYLFGGWGGLLPILFVFMVIDQGSGLLASYFGGELSSKVGFKGIAKKVMILCIIVVCNLIDQIFIIQGVYDGQIVRDGALVFYLGNELLSIIENAGRMGVPLPAQLINAVAVLKGKAKDQIKPL
jgi:toxin secretion/phage lysis holin